MGEYTAGVHWSRAGQPFRDNRYSRSHRWSFDGGAEVPGSSSPLSVPQPYSDASAVDPEEAFVASISSCHMLWFLSLAQKSGFVVDDYRDAAVGLMEKDEAGKQSITRVMLRPAISFFGERLPTEAQIAALHHAAHESCYIANSVRSKVTIASALRSL